MQLNYPDADSDTTMSFKDAFMENSKEAIAKYISLWRNQDHGTVSEKELGVIDEWLFHQYLRNDRGKLTSLFSERMFCNLDDVIKELYDEKVCGLLALTSSCII
jgi:hypothetical protein